MEHKDYISTLSEAERKALAVCGISKTEQLSKLSLRTLCSEIEQARQLFGADVAPLTQERITQIYNEATHSACSPETKKDAVTPSKGEMHSLNMPALEPRRSSKHRQTEEELKNSNIRELTPSESSEQKRRLISKSSAIRCTRPLRTYLSAVLLIWLFVALAGSIAYTACLLLGIMENNLSLYIPAGLFLSGVLPYLLIVRKTKCSVCNMPVLSMSNYPRNKHAHHFPLLGYTIPTALHLFFLLWYRCPACGTPQKLLKRRHHK